MKFTFLTIIVLSCLLQSPAWASPAGEQSQIGDKLAREGSWASAVGQYNKALEINPYYLPALSGKAAAMKHLKATPKAQPKAQPKVQSRVQAPVQLRVAHIAPAAAHLQTPHPVPQKTPVHAAVPPKAPVHAAVPRKTPVHAAVLRKGPVHAAVPQKLLANAAVPHAVIAHPVPIRAAIVHPVVPRSIQPAEQAVATPIFKGFQSKDPGPTEESPRPPVWLILSTVLTFALLAGLVFMWFRPTIVESKQLQSKMKSLNGSHSPRLR
ncbi:MAG: hypothetical protein ACRD3W_08225 [Terriglobales bacterium]